MYICALTLNIQEPSYSDRNFSVHWLLFICFLDCGLALGNFFLLPLLGTNDMVQIRHYL